MPEIPQIALEEHRLGVCDRCNQQTDQNDLGCIGVRDGKQFYYCKKCIAEIAQMKLEREMETEEYE